MDWFYHAPGEGRVGPLSAADLRNRYRDRRIQRDTLVWREGLREWQPLDRVADEIELHTVAQDSSLPPPLPASLPMAMAPAMAMAGSAGPAHLRPRAAAPAPRRMHGCLIGLIVGAVLAVPLIGILAAIALPEYQKYTVRAKANAFLQPRIVALRMGTLHARSALGRCPEDLVEAGLEDAETARGVRVGTLDDGRCAFEITLVDVDPKVDGRSLLHVAPAAAGGDWDCTGGDLPAPYRPAPCRGTSTE